MSTNDYYLNQSLLFIAYTYFFNSLQLFYYLYILEKLYVLESTNKLTKF